MAATTVGSLLVSLGLESVEFVRDTKRAESAIQQMSARIGAEAKAVIAASSKMGVSVRQFSNDVAAIKARLDPAATALKNYRQEMDLLRSAYKVGAITQQQFIVGTQQALTSYRANGKGVRDASGAMQAGMQQVSFQLSDVATQFASGTKPMQIFAQQSGQVVQAIALMSNGAGKFGAFMAGPWGIAITAGVVVLSALVPKLLETDSAMKDVEMASNGLADAQSVLGNMFDLTTGKLKNQNEMLRLNAQLMAINLRAQAATEKARSETAFRNFQTGNLGLSMGQKVIGALGVPVSGAMGRNTQVRQVLGDFQSGRIDSLEAARRAEGLDFSGLAVTKQEFLQAVADGVSYPGKQKIAEAIEKSLKDGSLDPSLRQPGTPKTKKTRSPSGKTAEEIAAEQAKEIERLGIEETRAKLDLATSAEERATLSYDLLAAEKQQRLAEIDANKDFSEDQKQAQKAYIERLYGTTKIGVDGQIDVTPSLYGKALSRELAEEEARLANDMLQRQAETLESWADIEPNTKERARLEAEALKLHQQIEQNLLDQAIASGRVADAEQAQVMLAQQQAAARERLRLQNMSPLEKYKYDIETASQNMDDALEQTAVNGMEAFNDGLVNAIVNFQSLGDVARSVIRQILADLIRLQIQKMVIGAVTNTLGALAGGGGGLDVSGGPITGIDTSGTIAGIPGFASGTTFAPGGLAVVGERGPELVNLPRGSQVIPNHELAGFGSTQQIHKPTFLFPGIASAREAREAAGQAARRYRRELNPMAPA